ncbi:MAG: 30S ribosomal protein S5 [Deltaproteobacteria bacterium]|nr:30S ribosomal protein S5 [Deltaproteobacteria bacterium]MCX7952450.1 30S ribosomal protein S5 [Deltaproteobacteria bacterium]
MAKKLNIDARIVLNFGNQEVEERLLYVARTAKVVAGGRRFRFSALVAVGDKKGHIGFALGKASEVPEAVKKATQKAKKKIIRIPLRQDTIPFEVEGNFCATKVILKPARPGTGLIAGSAVRSIVELAGVKNIRSKIIGSTNPHNVLKATIEALLKLQDPELMLGARGIAIQDIGYSPF